MRERLVSALLLAAVLLAPTGHAAEDASRHLVTAEPMLMLGEAELRGTSGGFWLVGDGRQAMVEIQAPVLTITETTVTAFAEVRAGPFNAFQGSPIERSSSQVTLRDARTFLVDADPDAGIKAAFNTAGAAELEVRFNHPAHVYPDATASDSDAGPSTEAGWTDGYDQFESPGEHFLAAGADAELKVDCTPTLLVWGAVLRVAHEDGVAVLDSRASTEGHESDSGQATVSTWVEHRISAPEGARMRIAWPDEAYVFGASMQLESTEGLVFGAVQEGVVEPVLHQSVVHDGPAAAQLAWVLDDGEAGMSVQLAPTSATHVAPHALGAGSMMAVLAATATLAVGATLAILYWRRTRASPPASDALEHPETHGMRLYHEHRFREALGPLREASKATPEDHEVRYALGVSLLRTGHFKEAFGHLRTAVRRMPIMLQMLVTSPETEQVRTDRRFETFIREEARVFKDTETTSHFGYC